MWTLVAFSVLNSWWLNVLSNLFYICQVHSYALELTGAQIAEGRYLLDEAKDQGPYR
jgi:hypothetical protein